MKGPDALNGVADSVERRIGEFLSGEGARWSALDSGLAGPFEALGSYVLSGGKRLRPAFCYWAFRGAGGAAEDPRVVDAGAALEFLHAAALVHDDLIDASEVRHGADAVHVFFARKHREAGWTGDAARFGEGMAILTGDLALMYSYRLLEGAGPQARAVFGDMCLEVTAGQFLDVVGAAEGLDLPAGAAVERAWKICRYKTAKYTVERPLHLGAALADPAGLAELAGPLSDFGLPLGEAFQLRDDLLGVFGDPAVTGKPVGDDIREGKPTLLAALAAERDPGGAGRLIGEALGRAETSAEQVQAIQSAIEASGARAEVEDTIAALVKTAEKVLAVLPLRPEAVDALGQLATFVAGREY
jgi:geranylgeranyl diphosphate synthase type I